MKASNPWITYRTRFLVKAKQLTTSLTFADVLGRQHSGRKGDYLVESSDGVLRIAPRQIFEDIYVPLLSERDNGATRNYRKPVAPSPSNTQISPTLPHRTQPQPALACRLNAGALVKSRLRLRAAKFSGIFTGPWTPRPARATAPL